LIPVKINFYYNFKSPVAVAKRRSKTTSRTQDPNQAREARKYENPIPSREFIIETLNEQGAPMEHLEIAGVLELTDEGQVEALRRRLKAMLRDGQLLCNRRDQYCVVNKRDLIAGRVIGHPDGFGFLKPDEGGEDLYLSFKEMRTLFHGDRAVVRVIGVDRRGRTEGAVVEVLERSTHSVVGRLHCEAGVGIVAPDNKRLSKDIVIPRSEIGEAKQGQMVVVEILDQPTRRTPPIGRITEVVGDHMGPGMETDIAIRSHEIPVAWPESVEQQIAGFSDQVLEADKADRVDLRKLPLVTIDGADARDFDDAVYCEAKPKGWRLLVCIADVSHYVAIDTPLDVEGRKRGNSVYFPDRVVPMLPEILSNGLCSLNPRVDRLCMACELYIDRSGKIIRSRFFPAVMHSHARLTYDKVAAMLDGDGALCEQYADVLPHIQELYQLFQVLHASRAERGAIEFDTTETRIEFNAQKRVERIVPVIRNDAHRIIEECMLAANVAAARLLLRKKLPAIYRVHEVPPEEKLSDLREFLGELALSLPGGSKPTAKDYATLLENVRGREDAHLIQTVLLRSMAQAIYSCDNAGHFGLSYPAYTHFTSPIRRYPDLLVHRALKHLSLGGKVDEFDYALPELKGIAEHCSTTERRADEATRDAYDWLKCEYMQDKVGECFDGIVTSVNSFGVFVELKEVHIDGLVHITALDNDFYHFDPIGHRLTGERTGTVIRLGDPMRIQVAAVNLDDRKIDFVLESRGGSDKPGASKRKRKSRKRGKNKDADKAAPAAESESQPQATEEAKPAKKRRRRRRPRKEG
jgi:ribonuclease R